MKFSKKYPRSLLFTFIMLNGFIGTILYRLAGDYAKNKFWWTLWPTLAVLSVIAGLAAVFVTDKDKGENHK